jgi:crotonobetainyl-CoA:carnitine CoA-transferase CaiB-like acyl-CoA transferase
VKLEPPEGDATRAMPPGGAGELFAALNRGKRSVVLDLKRRGSVEAVRRLSPGATCWWRDSARG